MSSFDKWFPKLPWYTRWISKVQFWFWDLKNILYQYKHQNPAFLEGARKAEAHILEDIEFGYTVDMIESKIKAHNYSYSDQEGDN